MALENNQEKSTHGGARPGAGRKPGSLTAKTREIAEKCAQANKTPLEVMVEAMIEAYDRKDFELATKYAKDAAPYMHPRLSNIELGSDSDSPLKLEISWQK